MNGPARAVVGAVVVTALMTAGCKSSEKPGSEAAVQASSAKATGAKASAPEPKVNADGTIASGDGVEREKPAAGKGNVQGRVLYNEKPAAGIEVKLCETFNRYLGGCSGETLTAKTDSNGEYLIKNVPPGIYEGLLVRVFDSSYFVFATSGIMQSAKYKIEADRTFFAADSALFKHDLKLISPKAGQKVAGDSDMFVLGVRDQQRQVGRWGPAPTLGVAGDRPIDTGGDHQRLGAGESTHLRIDRLGDADLNGDAATPDDRRRCERGVGDRGPHPAGALAQQVDSVEGHVDRVAGEGVEGGGDPVRVGFVGAGSVLDEQDRGVTRQEGGLGERGEPLPGEEGGGHRTVVLQLPPVGFQRR